MLPLAQDMIARFNPESRSQDLGDAVAAHVDPALRIADQQRVFLPMVLTASSAQSRRLAANT
ncbi:MAG: hypothetical protein ACK4ZJ_00060 [Allorhizobium sp.]